MFFFSNKTVKIQLFQLLKFADFSLFCIVVYGISLYLKLSDKTINLKTSPSVLRNCDGTFSFYRTNDSCYLFNK